MAKSRSSSTPLLLLSAISVCAFAITVCASDIAVRRRGGVIRPPNMSTSSAPLLLTAADGPWPLTDYLLLCIKEESERYGSGTRCGDPLAWNLNSPFNIENAAAASCTKVGTVRVTGMIGVAAERTFEFPDSTPLRIKEINYDGAAGTGHMLWDSGLVMSLYLRSSLAPNLTHASVVEVGAGTGLPGIDFARRIVAEVTLTDGRDLIVDLLRQNSKGHGVAATRKLDWSSEQDIVDLAAKSPDVVIASDVCYLSTDVTLIADLLARVQPKLVVLTAPVGREVVYDLCNALLARGAVISEERFALLKRNAEGAKTVDWQQGHFRVVLVSFSLQERRWEEL